MVVAQGDSQDGVIALDLGQSTPRYARRKRKKPAWVALLQLGAIPAAVAALALIGWAVVSQDSRTLEISPIADAEITQGDEVQMKVPVRHAGFGDGQLTYSLSGAPEGASIDKKTGVFLWTTTGADKPGTYQMVVEVASSGPRPRSDQQTFKLRLRRANLPSGQGGGDSGLSFQNAFATEVEPSNPFDVEGEVAPAGKLDELVFAKLKELDLEPANLCSGGVFLRRAHLDLIGTLPTLEEAVAFLDDDPQKRAKLVDQLLERPDPLRPAWGRRPTPGPSVGALCDAC